MCPCVWQLMRAGTLSWVGPPNAVGSDLSSPNSQALLRAHGLSPFSVITNTPRQEPISLAYPLTQRPTQICQLTLVFLDGDLRWGIPKNTGSGPFAGEGNPPSRRGLMHVDIVAPAEPSLGRTRARPHPSGPISTVQAATRIRFRPRTAISLGVRRRC